jgi:(p)ppGpp synthase/HD superfamily hydrolase
MNAVSLARGIAYGAHAGQVDKAGEMYACHVQRVAARLDDPADQVVAWLHDVLEDTAVTVPDLIVAGIPANLIDTVRVLTHRRHEPREVYYDRIRVDPRAVRVKLADIADNTDPDRLAVLDSSTRERLVEKYAKAQAALSR